MQAPPIAPNVLSLIGNTPIVELKEFDVGCCRLFIKLENQNPGGSIKDRMAVSMIEAAEASGQLAPGGTIVEATAGNTGLGLAQVAAAKGYRLILVIPDKMSTERSRTYVRSASIFVSPGRMCAAAIRRITKSWLGASPPKVREPGLSTSSRIRRIRLRMSGRPAPRFLNSWSSRSIRLFAELAPEER